MTPDELKGIIKETVSEELAAGTMTDERVGEIVKTIMAEQPHLKDVPPGMVQTLQDDHADKGFSHPTDELGMLEFLQNVHRAGNPNAGGEAKAEAQSKLIPLARDADIPVGLYEYVKGPDGKRHARLSSPEVIKTLYTGSDAAGGYIVPSQQETTLIDLVNTYSPLPGLCVQVPMNRQTITIPTLTGGLTGYWIPESSASDPADIDTQAEGQKIASSLTFGQISMTAKVAAARVFVTNQLLWDSDPSIEPILQSNAAMILADLFDTAILTGAGTALDPITGLDNLITTNSIPAGVNFDFDDIIDARVARDNVKGTPTFYLVGHNKAERRLLKVKDNDGQYVYKGPDSTGALPTIWGDPWVADNNVATNLGAGTDTKIYYGPFGQSAYVGRRMGFRVFVNPYSYAYANIVEFIFEMRVDFTVAAENHFSELTGVPTS